MRTRALPTLAAVCLGVVMIPLAGCNRENNPVHAEKDAQGNTTVSVDGQQVDQNVQKANAEFKSAGEQIKEGAQQAGAAIQQGAEKVQAKVEPVAKQVINDAGITAKVKTRLAADPAINALYVNVDTSHSKVTLTGKVALEAQKTEAEKVARETEGVTDVVNLLQVTGTPPAPPVGQ